MSRLRHSVDSSKETSNIALNPPHYYQPQHPLFQPAEGYWKHINALMEYFNRNNTIDSNFYITRYKQDPLDASTLKTFLENDKLTSFLGQTDKAGRKIYNKLSELHSKSDDKFASFVTENNAELTKELKLLLPKIKKAYTTPKKKKKTKEQHKADYENAVLAIQYGGL